VKAPAAPRTAALLVEDDTRLGALVTEYLAKHDIDVTVAGDGERGLAALGRGRFDVVLLDVMLPGVDGLEVCRRLRAAPASASIPVIMLTAKGDDVDKIVGLELGADDYLPKPFEPRELVARIQAVLRRGAGAEMEESVRYGELEVSWTSRAARLEGQDLALTTAEFELLGLLVRNRGRILSRDRILDETRGIDWEAYDRSIDVLVSRLRQKLGDDARRPTFIRTVRGLGYSFIGGGDA
jgi:two-component system phosphate regulon response regulator OmpR